MEAEVLQRLLKAEAEAEAIAKRADDERTRIIQTAEAEAQAAERRFEERIPSIRASFVDKTVASAEQTLVELKRRYEERHTELRAAAEDREASAVQAVLAILLDTEKD